jgi:8-oxo-dGTP diphosphatase
MKAIEVVAAVMYNQENQILIARRKREKSQGGKWEFPGGKVEEGESHQLALERELMEELNVVGKAGQLIGHNTHHYPNKKITLYAYKTEFISGEFKLIDHDQIEWISAECLSKYDLAEADIPIAKLCSLNI